MVASRPEVEWDGEQRGLMLALDWYRRSLCPLCGRPVSVCQDPDNEYRFTVDTVRCHAQTMISIYGKGAAEQPHPEALLFRTRLSGD